MSISDPRGDAASDVEALIVLRDALNIQLLGWSELETDKDASECEGVRVGAKGRVAGLDLGKNGLSGKNWSVHHARANRVVTQAPYLE